MEKYNTKPTNKNINKIVCLYVDRIMSSKSNKPRATYMKYLEQEVGVEAMEAMTPDELKQSLVSIITFLVKFRSYKDEDVLKDLISEYQTEHQT